MGLWLEKINHWMKATKERRRERSSWMGQLPLIEDSLRESLGCERSADNTPAPKQMISSWPPPKYPKQWRTSRSVCVCVCVCVWGYVYVCVWEGVVQIFLLISIAICSLHTQKILFLLSYAVWFKTKVTNTKVIYSACGYTRNTEESNLLSLHSVLPNNAVYGLFVITGPLTVSAVLISLRWIFPNPASIQVVQNVPAAPRQRAKEVNWILKCPQ